LSNRNLLAAAVVSFSLAAFGAHADTFAGFTSTDGGANMTLSGLTLSSSAPVIFNYQTANLSALGDLAANLSLTATETGALALGPIAFGTFDGTFALTYSGATKTAGGYTVHTGDDLLSGVYLGSVFTGYGTSASLVDSILAGGLVSFNDNNFLTFDPTGDESLSLDLESLTPPSQVIAGQLTGFSTTSAGLFGADGVTEAAATPSGIPEPAAWAMMLVGFAGLGGVLRRRRRPAAVTATEPQSSKVSAKSMKRIAITAFSLGLGVSALAATSANALTFATYRPVGTAKNISLAGLTLSSSASTVFTYKGTSLSTLGNLAATLSLNATETGAVALGPLALGTFDGTFAFTYSGATRTAGGHTVHNGDDLLSGTFLGGVFTGYGTSASLVDSILAGGLVSFNSDKFLTFDGLGDESMSLALNALTPPVRIVAGQLTNFAATSSGQFGADGVTLTPATTIARFSTAGPDIPAGVPEPATWSLMIGGFGLAGAALRRRRQAAAS
jgi:hypothetical protein